jgi:epsilon-lactone hydrolase
MADNVDQQVRQVAAVPSKQSEAVRRRWEASRLAMVQPGFEGPDDESWGDLTAEPRGVDYLETEAGGLPALWAVSWCAHRA